MANESPEQLSLHTQRQLARLEAMLAAAPPDERARHELRRAQLLLSAGHHGRAREALWRALDIGGEIFAEALLLLSGEFEREQDYPALVGLYATQAAECGSATLQADLVAQALMLLPRAYAQDKTVLGLLEKEEPLLPLYASLVQHQPRRARELAVELEQAGLLGVALTVREAMLRERHDLDSFDDALAVASLAEARGNKDRAYEAYRGALTIRPAEGRALQAARQHLLSAGAVEQLAELLAVSAPSAETPEQGAALWRELAQLSEQQLADNSRAIQAWWRAWELSDSGAEAAEIKRLYAANEEWTRYLDVLRQEALRTTDIQHKAEVFRELATFQREVLKDEEGAHQTYTLLLQIAPTDTEALERVIALGLKAKPEALDLAALRRLTAQYATVSADPVKRDTLIWRLLRLQLDHGETETIPVDLRMLDLQQEENLQQLEELWGQTLEPSTEDPLLARELAKVLLSARLRGPSDRAVNRGLALAQQSEAAQRDDVTAVIYRRLAAFAPLDEELSDRRQRFGGPNNGSSTDSPTSALAERAEETRQTDSRKAARLYVRAAQVQGQKSDAEPTVAELLRLAHECCPQGARAELELIESALRENGLHEQLTEFLQRELRSAEEAGAAGEVERRRLLERLARHQERQGQLDLAVGQLEQLHALVPTDMQLTRDIIRLHRALGQYQQLTGWIESLTESAPLGERIALLEEQGQIYSERLDNTAEATRTFGELLTLQPNHSHALKYVRAHAHEADAREVAVILARAAESHETPEVRAELFEDVARIAETQLDDLDLAISHWRQLQAVTPAATKPRRELKRLLASSGRHHEVESLLLAEVSRTDQEQTKIQLYLELAELARRDLDDPRLAVRHLRTATQLSPRSTVVLEALANLHEQLEQWRELATVLERHAELCDDNPKRLSLLHHATTVLIDRLQQKEEALAVCRRIHELAPGDPKSTELMAGIYRERQQWKQLVALLKEQCTHEALPERQAELQLEIGEVLLSQLNSPEAAASHFEQALEVDASRNEVLPVLRKLYTEMRRWDLLTNLIRRRSLQNAADEEDRAKALFEVGLIDLEERGDPHQARESFEQALRVQPDHLPSLQALRQIAVDQQQYREAVSLARRELEALSHAPDKARLLVHVAELLERYLDRPSAARETLRQALEEDRTNPDALAMLAADHFENARFEEAAELLERLVDHGEELSDLHIQLYRLGFATEQAGHPDEAFSYYVKSFSREPLYLPTLERLVDRCYQRHQWDNTKRIAEAIVTSYAEQKSPAELADLFLRLGLCELHVAQEAVAIKELRKLGLKRGQSEIASHEAWEDVARAWAATPAEPLLLADVDLKVVTRVIKAMEQALQRVPDHPGALQLLAALTMSHGDWDRSLRYLERASDASTISPRHRSRLLLAAGDIATHRLLSRRRGKQYYQRAAELGMESPQLRERLSGGAEGTSRERRKTKGITKRPRGVSNLATQVGVPNKAELREPPPPPSKRPPGRGTGQRVPVREVDVSSLTAAPTQPFSNATQRPAKKPKSRARLPPPPSPREPDTRGPTTKPPPLPPPSGEPPPIPRDVRNDGPTQKIKRYKLPPKDG